MPIYIIEHLEPEIWPWCLIEYKSISKIVGREFLWFTNIKQKGKKAKKLSKYGKIIEKSSSELDLKNSCVLDPESSLVLEPKEAKSFDYFIFGGILGDYPPRKRTTPELTNRIKNAQARNIGRNQFSTDNAVFVVNEIVSGKNLKDMKFADNLSIKINDVESIELPYHYPLVRGKPRISNELISYLKKKKTF